MIETRLTQAPRPLPKPSGAAAAHGFRRLGGRILVTNEAGNHALLSPAEYEAYLRGGLSKDEGAGKELYDKGFLREHLDFPGLAEAFKRRRLLDWPGPNVHTIVVTRRCNYRCLYCHASVVDPSRTDADMDLATARRAVDFAFRSPNPELMLEFQGGEPLLNWPVVRFIARYARRKNEIRKKTLHLGLISNLSLLDDAKLDFLAAHAVSLCTSLDGPQDLHNKNRVYLGGNSHAQVVAGIEKVRRRRAGGEKMDPPNAICTVTRFSLGRAREIVDHLAGLGIERIQLGPLDPIGFARERWGEIGYSPREFLDFYAEALDRVIELCRGGTRVYEKMAMIFLVRILGGDHWRFPNGDGLCRLAYNHDGDIYVSEEGRLLANEGDPFFRLGNLDSARYEDLFDHPTLKTAALAAAPEAQPMCFQCAYQPYCTVLPVYNYQTQGGPWGHMPTNGWCEKLMGIFDLLFERLQDPAKRAVLESWVAYRSR